MDEPGPSLSALTERLRLPPEWRSRLPHVLLLLGISVAAGFVLSPGLSGQQIPELTPEDIGRPFRSASPYGFKATRDYEIVHRATTELRRQEARAAVRPVYDFNPQVLRELRKATREAFALMREVVAEQPPEEAPRRRKPAEVTAELEERLVRARPRFQERLLGSSDTQLDDDDFAALVEARFSAELESAVLLLLDRAYGSPVATSREELSREGQAGIGVRDLSDLSEHVRPAAAPNVLDVREAQAELERFASVPGNLLPEQSALLRRAVLRVAKRLVRPNLTINIAESNARRQQAAEAVKEAAIQIRKGQKVIGDGELINEVHLVIISGMRSQTRQLDQYTLQLGATGLVGLLIAACYAFHRTAFRRFRPTRRDALLLGVLLVSMLALTRVAVSVADAIQDRYSSIPVEAFYYCIPVAAGAMLVRFILNEATALFFAVVVSALAGIMLGNSLSFGIYSVVGSLVAADRITRAKDRVGIFRAGVETGVANLVAVVFLAFAEGKGFTADTAITAGFALVGTAVAVPMVVMAATPLIEAGFGYASDIKLLELANLNHPALKELIVQAPGTYHHSIILGTMVENAAEAIAANPLLARSCAYYHDLGKGKNPLYFGENQKGENRHDTLAPAMSAVIIKRHVTDGMEMARQYRLPKLVADAIPQHHGTRLVGYFFHKALKEQEGKEHPQPIDESIYRYAGPKPQFKESALVMIADAVEASCRSMPDPTTQKLQAQVQKMINVIFSEGQLDECDLTLKDLNLIAQSFLHTLEGIYHTRPVYPAGAVGGPRPGVAASGSGPVPALAPAPPPPGPKKTAGA
jgi:hypothetical protein